MTEGLATRIDEDEDLDPAADLARPELVEGMSARKFDTRLLENPEISDSGDLVETDEGPGRLIRTPRLEGISWNVPTSIVLRNPRQPRTYFDPDKMRELKQTIASVGQEKELEVIPIKLESGAVKFFILDGERRFRVMKNDLAFENVNVTVKFVKNFWFLMAKSFIANESRAPQNPIERATLYNNLLKSENPELGRNVTVQELAELLGTEANDIYVHLRLLELPDSIQTKIINGTLPKSNTLQFARVQKNLGGDLESALVARSLLRKLYGDESGDGAETGDKKGPDKSSKGIRKRLTLKAVRDATHDALVESGQEDLATTMEAQRVALHIKGGAHGAENLASDLLAADPGKVVEALRDRAVPPEVVIDAIRIAIATLTAALHIIKLAGKADPLPELTSKPTFSQHIAKNLSSGKERQLALARILAEESDSGQNTFTSEELGEVTDMNGGEVGANLRKLSELLPGIGLKIEKYMGRRLSPHGQYMKVPAYRMEWILDPEEERKLKAEAKAKSLSDTQAEAIELKLATLTALGVDPRRSSKGSLVPTITEENLPALEIPAGKEPFAEVVKNSSKAFKSELRLIMAQVLANEADTTQKVLSAEQFGELLGVGSVTASNNIRFLAKELESLGLELQIFEIIHKDENGRDYRRHAYRISWKKEEVPVIKEEKKAPELSRESVDPAKIMAEVARQTAAIEAKARAAEEKAAKAEARAKAAEEELAAAKVVAAAATENPQPLIDKNQTETLTRQLTSVRTSRDDMLAKFLPIQKELTETRSELETAKKLRAEAEEKLAKEREKSPEPKPQESETSKARLSIMEDQSKRIDKLLKDFALKESEVTRLKGSLNEQTRKVTNLQEEVAKLGGKIRMLERDLQRAQKSKPFHLQTKLSVVQNGESDEKSLYELISENKNKFRDPLTFEIAKILAEDFDDEGEGMSSEEMKDLLEDFPDLTTKRIGGAITILKLSISDIGLRVINTRVDSQNKFKLERISNPEAKALPSTGPEPIFPEILALKDEVQKLRDLLAEKTREAAGLSSKVISLDEELAIANSLLEEAAKKPAPLITKADTPAPAPTKNKDSTPPAPKAKPAPMRNPMETIRQGEFANAKELIDSVTQTLALESSTNSHGLPKAKLRDLRNALTRLEFGKEKWMHEFRIKIVNELRSLQEEGKGDYIPLTKVQSCMIKLDQIPL